MQDQTWAIRDTAISAELGRELRTLAFGPQVQQVPGSLEPMPVVAQIPALLQQLLEWKRLRGWVLLDTRLRILQESPDHVPDLGLGSPRRSGGLDASLVRLMD